MPDTRLPWLNAPSPGFKGSLKEFSRNPDRTKENILSEIIGRLDSTDFPEDTGDERSDVAILDRLQQEAPEVARQVLEQGKAEGFDPAGSWRGSSTRDSRELAQNYLGAKSAALNLDYFKSIPEQVKTNVQNSFQNFTDKIRLPSFLSDSLSLRNPVVEPNETIQEGSFVNPDAINFLKNFKPNKNFTGTEYSTPFDASVNVLGPNRLGENEISFKGPFGYERPRSFLKRAQNLETDSFEAESIRNQVLESKDPLRSPAIRYALGSALEDIPVGSKVIASPIGGEKGSRARIYSSMTNQALAGSKSLKPNLDRYPSEEEFALAREGGGITPRELSGRNFNAGHISSLKTSPNAWINASGEERSFDPATLKDQMIRTAYNLSDQVDVSNLRNNPLSPFIRTNRIDFTKPVITTESPIYKLRGGIKAGIGVNAANFIPTPEAIRDFYANRPVEGFKKMGENYLSGIPVAVATGAAVTAAPVLAPIAAGAGLGMTAVAAGNALNEVSRQQTGEGIVPKFRQFIGTAPRTGVSSPQFAGTRPLTATIQPMTTAQRAEQTRRQSLNPLQAEFERRARLAQGRFNPSRGEFGLSELLFGR